MCKCHFGRPDMSAMKIWMNYDMYIHYMYTYVHFHILRICTNVHAPVLLFGHVSGEDLDALGYVYILDIYIYKCVTMLYTYIRLYMLHTYVATICMYIRRMHMYTSTYYIYVQMCKSLFCRSDKSTMKIWMS